MAIARRGQIEQRLQEPVNRGRGKEVASAHDVGDALERIVDRHRQMIARREIAPAENDVAPQRRLRKTSDRAQALAEFDPGQIGRNGLDRESRVEAPCGFFAAREATSAFVGGKRAACSRIERRRRRDRARRTRARLRPGCKSTDRRARATRGARAPRRNRRRARSAGAGRRRSAGQARRGRREWRPRIAACTASDPSLQCATAGVRSIERRTAG